MKTDLAELHIGQSELEHLAGLEINELFIGGLLGGTVRSSTFRHPQRFLSLGLTELAMTILVLIVTLPIGLITIRGTTGIIQDPATIAHFLQITVGIAIVIVVGWNGSWLLKSRQMAVLAALLDDADRYNEVIQAVDVLDSLEAVGNTHISLDSREQVLHGLRLARESLVCGVMTDRILRENRGLLARRYDLLASIESNLGSLRTLDVTDQASDYGHLLNQALQIGISVYQEIQAVSSLSDQR